MPQGARDTFLVQFDDNDEECKITLKIHGDALNHMLASLKSLNPPKSLKEHIMEHSKEELGLKSMFITHNLDGKTQ